MSRRHRLARCAHALGGALPLVLLGPATPRPASSGPLALEIASIDLVPQQITAGGRVSGSIRLDAATPAAVRIDLASTDPALARVPAAVQVATGHSSASFTVETAAEGAGCTRVTARIGRHVPRSAELLVQPKPRPGAGRVVLRLDSDVVVATGNALARVDLAEAAPAGGTTVRLENDNPSAATVPASIVVPPGATTQRFVIQTAVVGASTCAVISATVGAATGRALLRVIGVSGAAAVSQRRPGRAGGP